ncbi:RagB/SusD family nutrient uptake outer membrane protein [Pedobacter sp. BS3]|uniref:RagB/SusD family nutrient uptake outer membrane protein n=1 Tax=Pedobacter sp. BS3 TaxID=2567937 RepID=UPI0011EE0D2D|nr:RagB/SusD family nutrient uptake outer membrane protein [Pedobacter sp. BS3]TZF82237.1 RagB/SusD family nutrient uptake outer membrane protein [Pedobacter sp. BS3]
MKRNSLYLLYLFFAVFALSSCKDTLNEEAKSFVSPDQFYKNEGQCIAALNGCYNPLTSIFNQGLMIANEAVTDLAFLNSSSVDAKLEISPANPGMGDDVWAQCYKGVMYCNAAIAGIRGATIDEAKKPGLIGEAVTLRALYYYVLTCTFGDVPFYTQDVANLKTLEDVSKLGRMSATATRDSMIAELQQYAPSLPKQRTSDVPQNRISGSMAYMLIAKMAMWNKDYQTALTALKEIQKVYGQLDQYPLQDTWFRNKNTPESIFEVQFTWSATGLKKTTQVACFFTPSKTSGTSTYNGVNIPELGSKANPYTSVTPSEYFMSLYNVYDPRRNMILGYSYNGTWFSRPMSNNGTGKPWFGPKFWCPGMDNISDGNNQKVFRFADALLMMAECANELGDEDLAMSAINEIKKRAQDEAAKEGNSITLILSAYPGKEAFFKEVKEERARELMGEYGRKWDLVRWGTYYDDLRSTIALEFNDILLNLRPFHQYYPIPDSEVLRSGGVLDNPAYTGQ